MKVALVHHRYAPGGGMERYLRDLVTGFQAAGDALTVYARDIDAVFAARLGVPSRRIAVLPAPRPWQIPILARAVERLRLTEQFDLVISLARTRGQHVYICGGTHPGFLASTGASPGWRDRYEIEAERQAVQGSLTVAHARGLADELQRYYAPPAGRVHTLYPPVDASAFPHADAAARTAARAKFGLAPGVRYFLFPSMGHARKGFDLLLGAFAQIRDPNLQLLVAGRGAGSGLPAQVRALGYVDDMPALYAAVDGTVLPSRYEPFGLVLAESLQCGTPVITSGVAGMAELMKPEDGIVLPRLEVDALREALLQMAEHPRRVEPGFAQRRGLMLAPHVEALRALAPGRN